MAIFDAVADKVAEERVKSCIFPVGAIYLSVVDVNPSEWLCGTWERFGVGKTLIGVDESDTDFNAPEKTGGEKTHTLTVNEMPSHSHTITYGSSSISANNPLTFSKPEQKNYYAQTNVSSSSTGGGQAHNNLQPYITCYMWKRIA